MKQYASAATLAHKRILGHSGKSAHCTFKDVPLLHVQKRGCHKYAASSGEIEFSLSRNKLIFSLSRLEKGYAGFPTFVELPCSPTRKSKTSFATYRVYLLLLIGIGNRSITLMHYPQPTNLSFTSSESLNSASTSQLNDRKIMSFLSSLHR